MISWGVKKEVGRAGARDIQDVQGVRLFGSGSQGLTLRFVVWLCLVSSYRMDEIVGFGMSVDRTSVH